MRKTILYFLMVCFIFPSGCNVQMKKGTEKSVLYAQSREKTINPISRDTTRRLKGQSTEYLLPLDTSQIITEADFEQFRKKCWRSFCTYQDGIVFHYNQQNETARLQYEQKKMDAIKSIREKHHDVYVAWLDAKEMNDEVRQLKIEKSAVFSGYRSVCSQLKKIKQAEDQRQAEVGRLTQKAKGEYEKKERMAREAYERKSLQKNKVVYRTT